MSHGPRYARTRAARLTPLVVAGVAAFAGGMITGARHESPADETLKAFARAWEDRDYPAMYAQLAPSARRRASLRRFARTYLRTSETLTLSGLSARPAGDDEPTGLRVTARTRLFGRLSGDLRLPVVEEDGRTGVDWRAHHVFPGLAPGQELERTTTLPPRADLLARDGTPLAEGEARTSDLGQLAAEVAGRIGPAPPERAAELAARGIPEGASVGLTGLEREFDALLTGTPGGELRAGGRLVARAASRRGKPVRTTIDPTVQRAAVDALAGRFGGIAAIHPTTGEVLALTGIAASAPQPPGSTFKIVTLAGALDTGVVKRSASFPVQTETTLSGVAMQNANGEACGGSLRNSFAHSCNSVFAPLGAELGPKRLVEYAERFGFNEQPTLAGAARSTLPPAEEIGDDLATGATAIGQGKVLATALQMASVAATIANRGVRMRPVLARGDRDEAGRVVPAAVARFVTGSMRAVVEGGTGALAAVPGGRVAGKTGTAELRTTQRDPDAEPPPGEEEIDEEDETDTDAWFVAFAPSNRPRIAVAVLLVGQGTGGATAAPAARIVLERALKR